MLAATEKQRLRGVVAQSPPVRESFTRARTMEMANNREYLFDYVPAQLFTYQDTQSIEQLATLRERSSLTALGLLDRPMAPLLVIGGVHDTQSRSPISTCCCIAATRPRKPGSIRSAAIWAATPRPGPTR